MEIDLTTKLHSLPISDLLALKEATLIQIKDWEQILKDNPDDTEMEKNKTLERIDKLSELNDEIEFAISDYVWKFLGE